MSELINGLAPFTLNHVIVIHELFGLPLSLLIPTYLPQPQRIRIQKTLKVLEIKSIELKEPQLELLQS